MDHARLRPGGQLGHVLLFDRRERAVEEERVDVGPHVLVAERDPARLRRIVLGGEEGFPFVLKEPQKTLPAGENVGERPRLESGVFRQALQQVFNEEVRQPHLARVQRQQHLQQIDRRLDELRHDAEAVHQHELLGFSLGQLVAVVLLVRLVNGIEVGTIQPGDHRVVQLREQLVQRERQWPSGLEQIEGQLVQLLLGGTQDHHQVGVLALVPLAAILRLVGEAEGNRVIERDQIEASVPDGREHPFLGEQPVRVGHQGQPGNLRLEVLQDRVTPVSHSLPPPARE